MSAGGEWGQTSCDECEHRWGDGLPDSQDRPLPSGMTDCTACGGEGIQPNRRNFDNPCSLCKGEGIMQEGAP